MYETLNPKIWGRSGTSVNSWKVTAALKSSRKRNAKTRLILLGFGMAVPVLFVYWVFKGGLTVFYRVI